MRGAPQELQIFKEQLTELNLAPEDGARQSDSLPESLTVWSCSTEFIPQRCGLECYPPQKPPGRPSIHAREMLVHNLRFVAAVDKHVAAAATDTPLSGGRESRNLRMEVGKEFTEFS
jgi:hypothetical protein